MALTLKPISRLSQQRNDWSEIIARQLFDGNQKIIVQSDWEFDSLVKHATANKAVARILPALQGTDANLKHRIETAQAGQKTRLQEALRLLEETQKICQELNVPYAVMKSFDALPDLGHDIDLLVANNLDMVRNALVRRVQCYPVTLTFCDRQAHKFSTFIQGFTFDFELYATISQLGEEYYSERQVLGNRASEQVYETRTFLCSQNDRLLITCIHTMYRHGKIRLSDLNIAYSALNNGANFDEIVETVKSAGIQKGFALFITILESTGLNFLRRNIVPIRFREYSQTVLSSDPLLAWSARHLRQRFPLKLPIALSMLLFLYKAANDMAGKRFSSSLRSFLAPTILAIDKIIPLKLQKATSVRIW